jgi:protein SCO1/2
MTSTIRTLKIMLWVLAALCVVTVAGGYALLRNAQSPPPQAAAPAGVADGQAGMSAVPASDAPGATADALPVFFVEPHFALTDQSAKPFDSQALGGHVWVMEYVFTRCPGACPVLMSQMAKLDKTIADPRVRFVTITVDPDYDTPAVLLAKSQSLGADGRWSWLSGPIAQVVGLEKGMLIAADPAKPQMHSTKMYLFDAAGQCRGRYDYDDADQTRLMVATQKLLAQLPPLDKAPGGGNGAAAAAN